MFSEFKELQSGFIRTKVIITGWARLRMFSSPGSGIMEEIFFSMRIAKKR